MATYEQSRLNKFALRYAMYNDNFESQVKKHLTAIYTKASEIRLDKQLDLTNNIYKTIVYKTSRVYSFGMQRDISHDDVAELYRDMDISKTMKEANRYVNAFNDVLLQVSWDDKKEQPRLIFRLPHKTLVSLDEYDHPSEVEYYVSTEDKKEKWAYWSASEHYYKIYEGEDYIVEYPEDNENGVNPYGELPFVFMQNGFRDGNFFDAFTGDDLGYITLDNAVYSTFKNYLIKWQSFKQLVVTGSNIGELSGQLLDPSTALTASGQDVKIDLLDLQADLRQLDDTLQSASNNVAINYNISPAQFRMSSSVTSGFAMQMENTSLDEFTLEQQNDFVRYETDLFYLMQLISSANGAAFNSDFAITFNKPAYAESKADTLASNVLELDLGLRSATEIIMADRNIDEVEAQEILAVNLAERNKVYKKVDESQGLNMSTTAEAMGLGN